MFTYNEPKQVFRYLEVILPYLLVVLLLVLFQLVQNWAISLCGAILVIMVFFYKKYDWRIVIGCAIFLIGLSAFVYVSVSKMLANQLGIYSYYLLIGGIILIFSNYFAED